MLPARWRSGRRGRWGHGGVAFAHYARFVSVDPARNRSRGYELRWQPALWGGVLLVRTWGRLGARRDGWPSATILTAPAPGPPSSVRCAGGSDGATASWKPADGPAGRGVGVPAPRQRF